MYSRYQNKKDANKTIIETVHKLLDYFDSRYKNPGDYFYNKGLEKYKKQNYKKAESLFNRSMNYDFNKYSREEAVVKIVRCNIKQNKLDKAEEIATEETSKNPSYYNVIYTLGLIHEKKDEIFKAHTLYQDILLNDPTNFNVNLQLGNYYFGKNNYELAIKYYKVYLQVKSFNKEIRKNVVISYMNIKEYEKAIIEINNLLDKGFSEYKYLLNDVEELKNNAII